MNNLLQTHLDVIRLKVEAGDTKIGFQLQELEEGIEQLYQKLIVANQKIDLWEEVKSSRPQQAAVFELQRMSQQIDKIQDDIYNDSLIQDIKGGITYVVDVLESQESFRLENRKVISELQKMYVAERNKAEKLEEYKYRYEDLFNDNN